VTRRPAVAHCARHSDGFQSRRVPEIGPSTGHVYCLVGTCLLVTTPACSLLAPSDDELMASRHTLTDASSTSDARSPLADADDGAPCDASACWSCGDQDPKCGDGRCAHLLWNFDSGMLEDIKASAYSAVSVRTFDGSRALALDVGSIIVPGTEVLLTLPFCSSGGVDLRSRTLSFRMHLEGTLDTQYELYVHISSPDPQANAHLGDIGPVAGKWASFSSPMSRSAFSRSASAITIQVGTNGGNVRGTLWFDDFRIQ
jgi:hypothetical protein